MPRGRIRPAVRLLFASVFVFAFVSSEASVLLRLEGVRMIAFVAALGTLLALAVVRDPHLRSRDATSVAVLALLLSLILAADAASGSVDAIDYKVSLLLLLLLFAPNLARACARHDLAELVWRLLTVYVLATALVAVTAVPEFLLRGRPELARLDFTGSLVGHSGLCVVYLLATLARAGTKKSALGLAIHGVLGATAATMILLMATRTSLVTIAIHVALDILAARTLEGAMSRAALAALCVFATLASYTVLVSDDFLERLLVGSSEDWSSGRVTSQLHWLALALGEPLGLGFGAVRELLRDGRPALDGGSLLEWPHNEPLRFFVEAGLPGLLFVVLLMARLTRLAIVAARDEARPLPRALMLAIAADMLAQSLFQNYFNSIYHAVALLSVLLTLAASVEPVPEATAQRCSLDPRPDLPDQPATA